MNIKKAQLFILIPVIVAGVYFYFSVPKTLPQNNPVAPVLVARAEARNVPLLLALTGRAEALESVSLRARVDGQVQAVPMQEGGRVRKGDVLVQLDPADFAARLAQAEANLSRDQALAAKARADVERYVALRQKGFVSEEMLGGMRTNAAAQEAAVKASQAALDLARLQLGYATIRAPFDGVVGARLVFPGSAVKVNDTLLAVVNKVKPLFVSFAVPEKYLPKIRAAMKDGVMKVGVTVPGSTARETEGEARFLDNAVDATTGTIRMKAAVANADESLTVGQFLNISLALEQLKDVVTVPAEAVQQGPEGAYVYLAREDETVEVRRVEVTAIQGGTALLGKGAAAGEMVVIDGQLRLSPGARYRRMDAPDKQEEPAKDGAKPAANGASTQATPAN